MNRSLWLTPALLCLVSILSPARTWTNVKGQTIEADFMRMVGTDKVVLKRNANGKELEFPLGQLAEADRKWIAEQQNVMASKSELSRSTTVLTHAIRTEDFPEALRNITADLVNRADLGGYHPLTYAAYTRNPQLVESLLKGGADPDRVEQDGTTALFVASLLDQPEIIRMLHKSGADYPGRDNSRQPAAAAVRSDAVESMKVLLELYPNLDINAGWPWPEPKKTAVPDYVFRESPYASPGALLFATVAGYDGIARILITRGADPAPGSSNARTALHAAAENPRISNDVVSGLLGLGMDPFVESFDEHFAPRTPIDFAAASGSLEKVRTLTKGRDLKAHSASIRRSAWIASARGKGEIRDFLFKELGELPPTLTNVLAKAEALGIKKQEEKHAAIPVGTVNEAMPVSSPDRNSKSIQAGNIAIIASPSLANHAAMLTQALSGIEGLTVVERDEIDRVGAEKLLQQFGKDGLSGEGQDLSIIPAKQLIVLQDCRVSDRNFIKATLFSVPTRVTMFGQVSEFAQPDASWVDSRMRPLVDAVRHGRNQGSNSAAISLVPITPADPTPECLEYSRVANLVLPESVSRQPGAVLLTLLQMNHLETENAIAGEGSYWKAGWVVEGSLVIHTKTEVEVVLAAENVRGGTRAEASIRSVPGELAQGIGKAWNELAVKMGLNSERPPEGELPGGSRRSEAESVAKQARWFLDAGYSRDAYKLANAAYLLGDQDTELLQTMTEAAINRLPVQRRYASCEHVQNDPRVMVPEVRLRYAAAIPDYMTLCQCARLYTSRLENQLVSQGGGGRSAVFNEIVSQALRELRFYRLILQDCAIEDQYRHEVELLDRESVLLARDYLARCGGKKSEIDTIRDLFFRKGLDEIFKHDPAALSSMLQRVVDVIEANPGHSDLKYLIRDLSNWCDGRTPSADDPYMTCARKILSLENVRGRCPDAMAGLEAVLAVTTRDRKAALRRMLSTKEPAVSGQLCEFNSRLEYFRFFDCVNPSCGSVRFLAESNFIPGGIAGLIDDPDERLLDTGEFARFAGWYRQTRNWKFTNPKFIDRVILALFDTYVSLPADKRPSLDNLVAFRRILDHQGVLTPGIARVLDQLTTPSGGAEAGDAIPLTHRITFPELSGMAQFVRDTQSVIDGDDLWVPATYFEPGGNVINSNMRPKCRHVIHVVSLKDGSVRTIHFPEEDEIDRSNAGPTQRDNRSIAALRPVILGTSHAYFLKSASPARLYAVDRRTLGISPIDLPLDNVIAMAQCARDDSIYVSVAEETEDRKDVRPANVVLAITGNRIAETLVSSQRKPGRTPLDQPGIKVDRMNLDDKHLTLISNNDMSYIDPASFKGASLDWETNQWKSLSGQSLSSENDKAYDARHQRFVTGRRISNGQRTAYFAEDDLHGGIPAAIALVGSVSALADFSAKWLSNPTKSADVQLIRVSASPVADLQMDRKMFVPSLTPSEIREGKDKLLARTANQVIQKGDFDVQVLGKWRDQYLVFLTSSTVSMPAVWTIPEKELTQQLR